MVPDVSKVSEVKEVPEVKTANAVSEVSGASEVSEVREVPEVKTLQRCRGALNNEERNSKNELFFREKNETSHRGNCFSGARTKHAIAGIIFQVEERNKPLRELFSREERNKPPRTFIFRRQDRHGTPVALFFLPFAYGLETTGERTAATSV